MSRQRVAALGLRALDDRPYRLAVHRKLQHGGIAPDEDKRQVVIGVRGLSVGHTKRGLLGRKTPVFARDISRFRHSRG